MGAPAIPLGRRQRFQQLQAGGPDGLQNRQRGANRSIVVQPTRELGLIVGLYDRLVLRDQLAQADICRGLAIGEVMHHLSRCPAALGTDTVELVIGQSHHRLLDGGIALAESGDQRVTFHGGMVDRERAVGWKLNSLTSGRVGDERRSPQRT